MRIMNEAGTVIVSLLSSNIFSLRPIIFKENNQETINIYKPDSKLDNRKKGTVWVKKASQPSTIIIKIKK